MFHPSQLEKRFGGAAPTPTNFWPPRMGEEFNSAEERRQMNMIKESDYQGIIDENPLLMKHP